MFANFLSRSSGDPGIKGLYENYEKLTPDTAKMLKVTDERFNVPKDFNSDDFMRHSFKVMHDELYTVNRGGHPLIIQLT
jgi:hypothetical protein